MNGKKQTNEDEMKIDKNLEAVLTQVASKIKSIDDLENLNLLEALKTANEELTGRMIQFSDNKNDMNLLSDNIWRSLR